MSQKIYFDDGSILEVTIVKPEKGTMAMIAYRKLNDFLDEELFDDPNLIPLAEVEAVVEDPEDLTDLSLDEEDLEDLDEFEEDEWEDEDEFDDDWLEEEEEELMDDGWVMNR